MSLKKLAFAGVIALTLIATLAGTALAASADGSTAVMDGPGNGGPGGPGGRNGAGLRGEITAVGSDEFTILSVNGDEVTFSVDEDTRYGGDLDSFADLEVGLEVGVSAMRSEDDNPIAHAVIAGAQLDATRAGGEVTEVGADSLTIETRDGESLTFDVTADTEFHSRDDSVQSLSDISVGDHAMVIYEEDGSTLTALVIGSGTPQLDGDGPQDGFGPGGQRGSGQGGQQNGPGGQNGAGNGQNG